MRATPDVYKHADVFALAPEGTKYAGDVMFTAETPKRQKLPKFSFGGDQRGKLREICTKTLFFLGNSTRRPPDYSSNLCPPKAFAI